MKRSCLIVIFVAAVVLPIRVSWAQELAPANEMGVRMCHLHLSAADPEASREFWLMVGGTLTTHGPAAPIVKFPGVLIAVSNRAPTGTNDGSIVDHVGFVARNGLELLRKLQVANVKVTMDMISHGGSFYSPEGLKVEIREDPSLATPIAFDYVQVLVAEPATVSAMQAWYVTTFGAQAGVAADGTPIATIPGGILRFTEAASAASPQGRALDHFGFEIRNLEGFCMKTNGYGGAKPNCAYRYDEGDKAGITRISDPWGLSIELNEGYEFGVYP